MVDMYKVMIAEDEKFVRMGLKNMIRWNLFHMEVVCDAENGEEAYRKYLEYKPEIILTDLRMPVMDGMELIDRVRMLDKNTKFIIITCLDEFSLAQKAMDLGVSSYILKHSSDVEEIEAKLEMLLKELQKINPYTDSSLDVDNLVLHPKLYAAVEYIKRNYCENISLYSTAEHLRVTPNYLGKLFVSQYNRRFTEILNQYRVEKSKELLLDTENTVYSVAGKVGFSSSTYFIKVFKHNAGCTPAEFRQRRMSNVHPKG